MKKYRGTNLSIPTSINTKIYNKTDGGTVKKHALYNNILKTLQNIPSLNDKTYPITSLYVVLDSETLSYHNCIWYCPFV